MPHSLQELKDIEREPIALILYLGPGDSDPFTWYALLKGPDDTPFSNGTFKLQIKIPDDYPFVPPTVEFLTPVYHPNISTTTTGGTAAKICLDIIDPRTKMWSPALTIQKIVLSIASLLADPNPNDPLCPDIAKEMLRDKKRYEQKAKMWTY